MLKKIILKNKQKKHFSKINSKGISLASSILIYEGNRSLKNGDDKKSRRVPERINKANKTVQLSVLCGC